MSQQEANEIAREAQRRWRARGILKVALPTAAALGAGAAIAVGSIPGSDGTITGCYANKTENGVPVDILVNDVPEAPGALRVIDPSQPAHLPSGAPNPAAACQEGEATIAWNQSGPAGPQGPQGPQGPAGGQGASGAPGSPLIGDTSFGFSGPGSTFLKIDGIKGESTDSKHKGQIDVSSFSLGIHPTTIGSATGGAGSGRTTIGSFTITKTLDKSSPLLFQGEVSGQHYKETTLSFARKAGGTQHDYLQYKFENVLISAITDGTSRSGQPSEQVTFAFQKCVETFIGGAGRGGSKVSFNITANAKL